MHFFSLHVKWFTDKEATPLSMNEVISHEFLLVFSMTLLIVFIFSLINEVLKGFPCMERINRTLNRVESYTSLILRVGLGIGLLLQLMESTYLAPEFVAVHAWIKGILITAILGLIWKRTLFVCALSLTILYVYAIYEFGWFHTLDYIYYVGIIYYLLFSQSKWRHQSTPVLFAFTGLSLAWLGLEKLILPEMSYSVVTEYDIPTFGFSIESFVLIASFIEIGLAWTLITGVLSRFISIFITLIFITTTFLFGYMEIVGHTIIHAILIIFVIEREDKYLSPFRTVHSKWIKSSFNLLSFGAFLFGLMWIYIHMAS